MRRYAAKFLRHFVRNDRLGLAYRRGHILDLRRFFDEDR